MSKQLVRTKMKNTYPNPNTTDRTESLGATWDAVQSMGPWYAGAQTASYALTLMDAGVIPVDASGGPVILTLPAANVLNRLTYKPIKIDSSSNPVTLAAAGSDTISAIDGTAGTALILTRQFDRADVISNGVDNWLDWLSFNRVSARENLGIALPNGLMNPDGGVYQRTIVATADDTYMDDRWYALTQTGTITPSQVNYPEDGYRFALRLTQSQGSAQRMGRAQIMEGRDVADRRGKTVTAGGRFRYSGTGNIRQAILAWTGTEDAVTSDVVNNWTSGTYTTGNFFASSNLTLVATSNTALTSGVAKTASISGVVPTNANNLIYFYWTEAAAANASTLDAWAQRLVNSASLVDYIREDFAAMVAKVQRFAEATDVVHANSPSTQYATSYWKARKRASPTLFTSVLSGSGAPSFLAAGSGLESFYQNTAPTNLGTVRVLGDAEL